MDHCLINSLRTEKIPQDSPGPEKSLYSYFERSTTDGVAAPSHSIFHLAAGAELHSCEEPAMGAAARRTEEKAALKPRQHDSAPSPPSSKPGVLLVVSCLGFRPSPLPHVE